jgi:hypothetical protein
MSACCFTTWGTLRSPSRLVQTHLTVRFLPLLHTDISVKHLAMFFLLRYIRPFTRASVFRFRVAKFEFVVEVPRGSSSRAETLTGPIGFTQYSTFFFRFLRIAKSLSPTTDSRVISCSVRCMYVPYLQNSHCGACSPA